ncbi:MAG TPA: hypothetical protein V6D29_19275 [Leptolyngbyaceae cyanobacterium]
MPPSSKKRGVSDPSKASVFFAALALQFFFWFGVHLLSLQLAEGDLQRPYGCSRSDENCLAQHRYTVALRTWLTYLAIAPPLAGLAVHRLSRQQPSKLR